MYRRYFINILYISIFKKGENTLIEKVRGRVLIFIKNITKIQIVNTYQLLMNIIEIALPVNPLLCVL